MFLKHFILTQKHHMWRNTLKIKYYIGWNTFLSLPLTLYLLYALKCLKRCNGYPNAPFLRMNDFSSTYTSTLFLYATFVLSSWTCRGTNLTRETVLTGLLTMFARDIPGHFKLKPLLTTVLLLLKQQYSNITDPTAFSTLFKHSIYLTQCVRGKGCISIWKRKLHSNPE